MAMGWKGREIDNALLSIGVIAVCGGDRGEEKLCNRDGFSRYGEVAILFKNGKVDMDMDRRVPSCIDNWVGGLVQHG
jgi:hypothetical protein